MPLFLTFLGIWGEKKFKYLTIGDSFASLGYSLRVGKNAIKGIVLESGKAIWKILQPVFMAGPISEEWLRIADEFNNICKMLNCVGSIEGKHCHMQCPPNAIFLYFNYKSFHAINLLGVADTKCCFTLTDVEPMDVKTITVFLGT